jgi:dTDP-4-amino-4,6-dideoxygalactose transaminase
MSIKPKISLMRPLLLGHESAIHYLAQIDKNRWYSNFGPLVQKLEERLCGLFGTGEGSVVTLSNGTAGLVNILRAMNLPRGSLCLLPSWTFIATPASVIAAGLTPYFMDVDETTWALDPEAVKQLVKELEGKVSAVMVVAPFGSPLDTAAWDTFTDETGIPVIIDAAAGFDAFSSIDISRPRRNPVMVSMHATKTFGVGEGGAVISTNTELIKRVQQMSNFGFSDAREIAIPGTNGKMSEYTAAFALAALDLWPQTREYWHCRKWFYAEAFKRLGEDIASHPWINDEWASSTFSVRLTKGNAMQVIAKLVEAGIESRQWWGKGCHVQPAYRIYPHAPLPVTEALGRSVLALPFSLDINEEAVHAIMQTLANICSQQVDSKISA